MRDIDHYVYNESEWDIIGFEHEIREDASQTCMVLFIGLYMKPITNKSNYYERLEDICCLFFVCPLHNSGMHMGDNSRL